MIVGGLTACHKQYTWDRSIFHRTRLQVFVTHLHPLWFYKHQHDNPVRSACQRWWFQWRFWFVPSVPGYTRTLSLETVHTTSEWNCQMVVVSRIWCGIAAGQFISVKDKLYPPMPWRGRSINQLHSFLTSAQWVVYFTPRQHYLQERTPVPTE